MTSSTSSRTRNLPDGKKGSKGGNRARPRPEKVRSGRVSKHQERATHRRVSIPEVQVSTNDVDQEPQRGRGDAEIISSSEDDAYEHAGTDQDCSEGSGSPTDKDTPTRLALERRREAKGKNREKITSRRMMSPRDLVRKTYYTPSKHVSSSVGRSSPCVGRTPAAIRRSPSLATSSSFPLPSAVNTRFLSIEPPSSLGDLPDAGTPRVRKNTVSGGERQLLDRARDLVLDYTLFQNPFPSAHDLTEFIHSAWVDSQEWHKLKIDPTAESLNNVSTGVTLFVGRRMLTGI